VPARRSVPSSWEAPIHRAGPAGARYNPPVNAPRVLACALLAAALVGPPVARAYEEALHQFIGAHVLPDDLPKDLVRPKADDVDALLRATWRAGAGHPDPVVRGRFLARFPAEAAFDAWALKELLGLTPEAQVEGIDLLPDLGLDARLAAAVASRQPDEDRRNVERFAHDAERRVRRDAWGRPLPADPAQLDLGALTGLSSQAHAHYGLPHLAFSDSPDVLKSDPRRFASPPDARAFAADFAQAHTDLALAAAALGTPGGRALAWRFLGNAHHYLEDVANQIHTLQAIYPFFVDAKLQSWKEEALSAGGLLRSRPTFLDIGIGIIQNHHLFLENLWSKRVRDAAAGNPAHPRVSAAIEALGGGDPDLERALDARGLSPHGAFARAIAEEVIEASSREGGEVYEAARALARRRLSRSRYEMVDGSDPDLELRPSPDAGRLDRFYELEGRGFGRAASAVRLHTRLFREALASAERSEEARRALSRVALERLVADGTAALDAREARLAAYRPRAPEREEIDWWAAGALAAVLAGAGAVAYALGRRRSRR